MWFNNDGHAGCNDNLKTLEKKYRRWLRDRPAKLTVWFYLVWNNTHSWNGNIFELRRLHKRLIFICWSMQYRITPLILFKNNSFSMINKSIWCSSLCFKIPNIIYNTSITNRSYLSKCKLSVYSHDQMNQLWSSHCLVLCVADAHHRCHWPHRHYFVPALMHWIYHHHPIFHYLRRVFYDVNQPYSTMLFVQPSYIWFQAVHVFMNQTNGSVFKCLFQWFRGYPFYCNDVVWF